MFVPVCEGDKVLVIQNGSSLNSGVGCWFSDLKCNCIEYDGLLIYLVNLCTHSFIENGVKEVGRYLILTSKAWNSRWTYAYAYNYK